MNKRSYSALEIFLLAAAAIVLASASFAYFSGFSIKRYLSGDVSENGLVKVGDLQMAKSLVRRQLATEQEFRPIRQDAPLFNEDTVSTAENGSATIALNDGSTLQLGPGAMIKLAFETNFELGGISRVAKIQVVSGQVVAQAKKGRVIIRTGNQETVVAQNTTQTLVAAPVRVAPPTKRELDQPEEVEEAVASPSPVPGVRFAWLEPKLASRLTIEEGSPVAEKHVKFAWKVSPDASLDFELLKIDGDEPESLIKKNVVSTQGEAALIEALSRPGVYEWRVSDPSPQANSAGLPAHGRFAIMKDFQALELEPATLSGLATDTNRLVGQLISEYELELHWKPYRGATRYIAVVGGKRFTTTQSELGVGQLGLHGDLVRYSVTAELESGFMVHSRPATFSFKYLAPAPVTPENNSQLKAGALLLVWQKTNFTTTYEVEVARDPSFRQVIFRKRTPENFASVRASTPAIYYWRVRSIGNGISSPFGSPTHFSIAR